MRAKFIMNSLASEWAFHFRKPVVIRQQLLELLIHDHSWLANVGHQQPTIKHSLFAILNHP